MSAASHRVAVVAAILTGLAVAAPSPSYAEDDTLSVELGLPESIPGAIDDDTESVDWTVKVGHGADVAPPAVLTMDFGLDVFADDSPVLVNVSDDRCESTDSGIECTAEDLTPGGDEFSFLLRDNWNSDETGPITVTATVEAGGQSASDSGEFTITADERLGRVSFDAPDTISADQLPGTDGVPMPVTVTNNSDAALTPTDLRLRAGVDDQEVADVQLGGESDRCEGTYQLSCALDGLEPGESVTFDIVLFADPDAILGEPTPLSANVSDGSNAAWGSHQDQITVVKAENTDEDVLPVTGMSLTLPLAGGAGALLVAGVALLLTRRRTTV
jgi:hypothetical protein